MTASTSSLSIATVANSCPVAICGRVMTSVWSTVVNSSICFTCWRILAVTSVTSHIVIETLDRAGHVVCARVVIGLHKNSCLYILSTVLKIVVHRAYTLSTVLEIVGFNYLNNWALIWALRTVLETVTCIHLVQHLKQLCACTSNSTWNSYVYTLCTVLEIVVGIHLVQYLKLLYVYT